MGEETSKGHISKVKEVLKELKKIETLGELIDHIPRKVVEKVAFFLLLLWSFSLIITMVYGHSAILEDTEDWVSQLNQMYATTINWNRILQQIGFLGSLLGLTALAKSLRKRKSNNISKKTYLKERIVPMLLFLMLVWSFISFLFADDKIEGLRGGDYRKDGILTYFAVAGIFSCAYIIKSKKYIKRIIEVNTLVAFLQSVLILVDSDRINRFFGLTEGAGIFLNINHCGYYLAMTAMCAIYLIMDKGKSKIKNLLSYLAYIIIIAALVKNGSFGPYLATLCAIISGLILSLWLKRDLLGRIILVVLLFTIVTIIMNIAEGNLYLDFRIFGIELGMIFKGGEDLSRIGTGRGILWSYGMRVIADKPILGVGPGNLNDVYYHTLGVASKPHNEFIEYGATLGIPGLLFYVSALFMYLREFFIKRKNASLLVLGLLCVSIAYLVSSLVGVIMYHTLAFFFMFLGLSLGQIGQVKRPRKEIEEG